jgi:hypothetical protein
MKAALLCGDELECKRAFVSPLRAGTPTSANVLSRGVVIGRRATLIGASTRCGECSAWVSGGVVVCSSATGADQVGRRDRGCGSARANLLLSSSLHLQGFTSLRRLNRVTPWIPSRCKKRRVTPTCAG